MKYRRLLHFILVLAVLASLVAGLWWSAIRMGEAARAQESQHGDSMVGPPMPPAAPALPHPVPSHASALDPDQFPERRALRAEVVASQEHLARVQAEELDSWNGEEHSEEARAAAMAAFAQSHHADIQAAADAQDRYLRPAETHASNQPRTAFDSVRARSSAVRSLVLDEGLSLEAAETRHPHSPTTP